MRAAGLDHAAAAAAIAALAAAAIAAAAAAVTAVLIIQVLMSESCSSTGGKTSWIERVGKVFFFFRKVSSGSDINKEKGNEKERKGKEYGKGREGGE